MRVPIALGSRDKTLARVFAEPGANSRPEAVILPRMSFELTGVRYDSTRHQSSVQQIRLHADGSNTYSRLYAPVPYDFDFSLFVYSKAQEDGLKIVEQILPFFTPDFTPRAELIPGAATMNLPVTLTAVSVADDYAQGAILERRAVVWNLTFTMRGWLFGPEHQDGIIKLVDVPLIVPRLGVSVDDTYANNTGAIDEVTVQPGLLANGAPTTNAAASVPYTQVELEDDWAYAVVIAGDLDPAEGTGGSNTPLT